MKAFNFKLPCKRSTCRYGSCENVIQDNVLTYECHCQRGITGKNCNILDTEKLLHCASNPCHSGKRLVSTIDYKRDLKCFN